MNRKQREDDSDTSTGHVKVMCRFRPLNEKEMQMGDSLCVQLSEDERTVVAKNQYDNAVPLTFNFDRVFSPDSSQSLVYESAALPIVECVLKGYNGTILAYGQTSSGKTHTMIGPNIDDQVGKGIIPRMINTVFCSIEECYEEIEFTVKVGYCEIYLEKIRDLLNNQKTNLKILEDKARGVYINDLTEEYVSQELEVFQLMKIGNTNRVVGHTDMNEGSSRSHAIFMITVSQNNLTDYSARTGKLYLVDLAGSEKTSKTNAKGKRLDEAKKINLSLSTLGKVIYSLTDGKSAHIPYRDSKLTRVLQDSLGGNSKTCLIIACSPSFFNEQETLSTLRFGDRAKCIKNSAKINRELTIPELKLLLAQSKEELTSKHARIQALEKLVVDLGGSLNAVGTIEEEEEEYHPPHEYKALLEDLERERERLEIEIENTTQARAELAAAVNKNEKLMHENEGLNSKTMELLLTLGTYEDKAADYEDTIQNLQKNTQLLQEQAQKNSAHTLELEKTLSSREAEIENLQTQLLEQSRTKAEFEDLQKKYSEQSELLLASYANTKASLEETLKEQWQQEKLDLLAELSRKTDYSNMLQQENESLKESFNQKEETKQDAYAGLKMKVNSLEQNLKLLTVVHEDHVTRITLLQNEKKVLEKRLLRRNERLEKLNKQLRECKEEINLYKNQVDSMQNSESSRVDPNKTYFRICKKIRAGQHPRLAGIISNRQYEIYDTQPRQE